jgi:hypothetical protein
MVIMKEHIPLHLSKGTTSAWSVDKVLSEEGFSDFIDCFYKQQIFLATAESSFHDFFSIDSFLELLNTRRLSFPRCRLIKDGALIPPASYTVRKTGSLGEKINALNVTKVTQLVSDGVALVIDFCEDLWGDISDVCDDFSEIFSEKTGATLFFSSGQKVGFTAHWDNSDVIVYQLSGKKRWKIYPKTLDMPIDENNGAIDPPVGDPFFDKTLEANNILYVPRGYWHAPEPCGEHSLHISFAFRRRNGMDYLKWLIPKLCDELIVRKDIDRHADSETSTQYINILRATLFEYINDSTLHDYIESCNRRDLKKAVFTKRALFKE